MSDITFKGPDNFVGPINFVHMYSDGTSMVKSPDFENIVAHADTLVVRPTNMNQFVTAMFLVDAVNQSGGWIKRLVLPYVPGARQDRINVEGDVLFTAKSVAEMINMRQFNKVVVLDPHSSVVTKFIDRVSVYPITCVVDDITEEYDGVIAPDAGADQRAGEVSDFLEIPFVQANKTRDVATGKLSGFEVTVEKGKHYLVVDDICDGGGTFIGLGEKIAEQGATADLYVSHGIFSKGTVELAKFYKHIYTTDSRPHHERSRITVLEVLEEMEKY